MDEANAQLRERLAAFEANSASSFSLPPSLASLCLAYAIERSAPYSHFAAASSPLLAS